jgi:serine protease DegS
VIRTLLFLLCVTTYAIAGPPPKRAALDPFGNGYMGIYRDTTQELLVERLEKGGPAEKAGVLPGDVLYEVGGIQPQTFEEVRGVIGDLRPGTKVPIIVKRGEQKISLTLTLGERPESTRRPVGIEEDEK